MYGVMYCTCNLLCVCVYTLVQVHVSIHTNVVESKLAIVMILIHYAYSLNGPFSQSKSQQSLWCSQVTSKSWSTDLGVRLFSTYCCGEEVVPHSTKCSLH